MIALFGILAVLGWTRVYEENQELAQCRSFIEAQALEFQLTLDQLKP